ncbi:MAG: hypothetical protein MHM6MM_000748 [Cercozoa sp. M6MM]
MPQKSSSTSEGTKKSPVLHFVFDQDVRKLALEALAKLPPSQHGVLRLYRSRKAPVSIPHAHLVELLRLLHNDEGKVEELLETMRTCEPPQASVQEESFRRRKELLLVKRNNAEYDRLVANLEPKQRLTVSSEIKDIRDSLSLAMASVAAAVSAFFLGFFAGGNYFKDYSIGALCGVVLSILTLLTEFLLWLLRGERFLHAQHQELQQKNQKNKMQKSRLASSTNETEAERIALSDQSQTDSSATPDASSKKKTD